MSTIVAPLLMTPGPTRVPERVLRAGAQPMLHHRSAEFSAILRDLLDRIRPLFAAAGDVLPVHGTGRAGLEAAICNLFSPGDEIVACCNGKFGEMWAGFAQSWGLVVHRVCTDWGRAVDVAEVDEALRTYPQSRGVTVAHCDTSTGALNDVASLCALARDHGALAMVDCISALGGVPFAFNAWGADVAVTASQKCLMSSPGLAFVAVSDRAWDAYATARLTRNYWDFGEIRKTLAKARPETPGTTPVHIVMQVREALLMIHEEGVERVYDRHAANAALTRAGAADLGLLSQSTSLSSFAPTVTALAVPAGIAPKQIRDALRGRGIMIAGGLGPFQATSIRIGHMGDIRAADIRHVMTELGRVLAALAAAPASAGR